MNKEIDIKDTKYTITTVKEKGHFYGTWVCLKDGHKGESSKVCASEQEALEAGEHNARADWGFKYGSQE